jgi:hypothetical protein
MLDDPADAFASMGMAPRDAIFQGWPAGQSEDRPL